MPPHLTAAAKTARYNLRVFLAPYWDEIFTQDTERKLTRAEAEATCAVMRQTYTALGYEIRQLSRTAPRGAPTFLRRSWPLDEGFTLHTRNSAPVP
ncbi:AAA family ATPase [Qingshengfaniella alkalisoli]|uniref:AAA family ATPase n=1 Tax=Qingshengfaniella alkalisoli TaxID=2599296 RepID=UPI00143E01F1|nr:AAA family ATPase [Qingshengfaniella alkalisoli]